MKSGRSPDWKLTKYTKC